MKVTAEARLWWPSWAGKALLAWFDGLGTPAPGGTALRGRANASGRTDVYLLDPHEIDVGIKVRAAGANTPQVEIKTLISREADQAPFGPVTLWAKVSSTGLRLETSRTVAVTKWRTLRRYEWHDGGWSEVPLDAQENSLGRTQPERGCDVELTRVAVEGVAGAWHTVACEAFGPLGDVERILRHYVEEIIATRFPPDASGAEAASYPEFLSRRLTRIQP